MPLAQEEWVRSEYGVRRAGRGARRSRAPVVVEPGTGILTDLGEEAFDRAVDAARDADVVVLAIGGASAWFVGDRTEGEASDSLSIELPAIQRRLIDAIIALGKPTVAVLISGPAVRPACTAAARSAGDPQASYNGVGGTQRHRPRDRR